MTGALAALCRRTAARTLFLLCALASLGAARSIPAGVHIDPFADPKHDPFNPLKYITSNTLTAIAICKLSFLPPSPSFSSYAPRGGCEVGRSRATGAAPAGTLLTTTTTLAFLGAGTWRRWEAGAEAEVEVEAAA